MVQLAVHLLDSVDMLVRRTTPASLELCGSLGCSSQGTAVVGRSKMKKLGLKKLTGSANTSPIKRSLFCMISIAE